MYPRPGSTEVSHIPNTYLNCLGVIGQHGHQLFKGKSSHRHTKNPQMKQQRNKAAENAWLLRNIFDVQGNYLYCYKCILEYFRLSPQRLTRLCRVKCLTNTAPIKELSKQEVTKDKLTDYVLPPQSTDMSFSEWWKGVQEDTSVE